MANQNKNSKNYTDNDIDLRVPPYDINAEAAVISAMLVEDEAVSRATEILRSEDFYKKSHKMIFQAMRDLFNEGGVEIDLITLIDKLKTESKLEEVGGTPYLSEISDVVASGANISAHAKIVLEKSILRKLIRTSRKIIEDCYNSQARSLEIIEQAEKDIFEVTQNLRHEGFMSISDLITPAIENIKEIASKKTRIAGIATGFHKLDDMIGGFKPGQFIVIAGRPSMGKTSFALNIGFNSAIHHGTTVGIFSLEMDKETLLLRMLSSAAEIKLNEMLNGYAINQQKIFNISKVGDKLAESSIFIDDRGNNTIPDIRSKARRLKSEVGLDLIILDYMQLMIPVTQRSSRTQEITEISRGIKLLAKELEVPIISLSQLSRSPETRNNKRPVLADLRESGAIEQDADLVLLLYRDEYYNKDTEEPGIAEIHVAKNRNGPQGVVRLNFIGEYTQFTSLH